MTDRNNIEMIKSNGCYYCLFQEIEWQRNKKKESAIRVANFIVAPLMMAAKQKKGRLQPGSLPFY